MTCSAEILPQYVHSIATNTCPGCGGQIYDDQTKELYTELKDAMIRMPNDPVGLAGWLLDNYKLIKIGSAEPVEKFYSKETKQVRSTDKKAVDNKKTSSTDPNEFFQRAGVSPTTKPKNKNYAAIVEELNSSIENSMYGGEEIQESEDISDEEYYEDLEAAKEMGFMANDAGVFMSGKPLAKSEINEMKNVFKSSQSDFEEQDRLARLQRQNAILNGSGGFKRG
jgi:hypothetical protein